MFEYVTFVNLGLCLAIIDGITAQSREPVCYRYQEQGTLRTFTKIDCTGADPEKDIIYRDGFTISDLLRYEEGMYSKRKSHTDDLTASGTTDAPPTTRGISTNSVTTSPEGTTDAPLTTGGTTTNDGTTPTEEGSTTNAPLTTGGTPTNFGTTPTEGDQCPQGSKEWQSHCYKYSGDYRVSWTEAVNSCLSLLVSAWTHGPADLVSVHSKDEQDFVYSYWRSLRHPEKRRGMWIGLTDFEENGVHRWSDETAVDYAYFDWHQQLNIDEYRYFMMDWPINNGDSRGKWHDIKDDVWNLPFMCKITRDN